MGPEFGATSDEYVALLRDAFVVGVGLGVNGVTEKVDKRHALWEIQRGAHRRLRSSAACQGSGGAAVLATSGAVAGRDGVCQPPAIEARNAVGASSPSASAAGWRCSACAV